MADNATQYAFTARVEQFLSSMGKMRSSLQDVRREAEQIQRPPTAAGGGGDVLAGALKLSAVFAAVRAMGQLGKVASEFSDQVQRGEKSLRDIPLSLAQSIPLVSDLHNAFLGIANSVYPVGVDLSKQIEAQSQLGRKLRDALNLQQASTEASRARLQAEQQYRDTLAQIAAAESAAGAGSPAQKAAAAAAAESQRRTAAAVRDNAIAEAEARRAAAAQATAKGLADQIAKLSMTSEEYVRYQAAVAGATGAEIEFLAALERERAALEAKTNADKAAAAAQEARTKAVADSIAKLQEQAELLGMTTEQIELYRLEQQRATPEQIRAAKAALAQIEAQRQLVAAQDRAKQLFEATRTPLERYRAALEEIERLAASGALDPDTAGRARQAAKRDLAGQATAAAYSSVEAAFSRITEAAANRPPADEAASRKAAVDTARACSQLVEIGLKQNDELRAIRERPPTTTATLG
jgi:hypothetical protein